MSTPDIHSLQAANAMHREAMNCLLLALSGLHSFDSELAEVYDFTNRALEAIGALHAMDKAQPHGDEAWKLNGGTA